MIFFQEDFSHKEAVACLQGKALFSQFENIQTINKNIFISMKQRKLYEICPNTWNGLLCSLKWPGAIIQASLGCFSSEMSEVGTFLALLTFYTNTGS